jgi:WD40 repeat protein
LEGHRQRVKCVAFAPDGRLLASGSTDGELRLWNPETGEPFSQLVAHANSIYSVAFSADARLLATASFDRTIKLWSVAT